MSKTTITPVYRSAFEADREARARSRGANIRGMPHRGKRAGMSRRRASFRHGKWIDVLRACLRRKRRRSSLDSSGLYRQRKSTWSEQRATEPAGGRAPAMNHRFNPRQRIIHR